MIAPENRACTVVCIHGRHFDLLVVVLARSSHSESTSLESDYKCAYMHVGTVLCIMRPCKRLQYDTYPPGRVRDIYHIDAHV